MEEEVREGLKRLSQRENVTLFMVLETAFAVLVSRYGHESDVVIGTPIAGRVHEEVEPLVGFLVNNLALRSRWGSGAGGSGAVGMREVLREQKQMILEAYAHQDVPFEMLVERLNPERDVGHDPIFQIVFSLNNNQGEVLRLPGLEVEPVLHGKVLAKVILEVVDGEGRRDDGAVDVPHGLVWGEDGREDGGQLCAAAARDSEGSGEEHI